MIYIYIMATADKKNFHCGYSTDIERAIKFYKELPAIDQSKIPHLVYLEGYTIKEDAAQRFKEIFWLNSEIKTEIVKSINHDFVELIPGHNVDI